MTRLIGGAQQVIANVCVANRKMTAIPEAKFVCGSLGSSQIPWFPRVDELLSEEIYVYPWSIDFRADRTLSISVQKFDGLAPL